MRNPKVQLFVVTVLLIAVGILLIPSMTQAEPKGMPWQNSIEDQRDGYSGSFVVDANSMDLIEVPAGRCYVILRLYAKVQDFEPPWFEYWEGMASYWRLTLDGELFLDEYSLKDPYRGAGTGVYVGDFVREDFPDKCVIVNGGQTLEISKPAEVERINITLIGYFCDMP